MCKSCRSSFDDLARYALGEAKGSVCPNCAKTIEEIQVMVGAMRHGFAHAPSKSIEGAKSIFGSGRKQEVARCIKSSFSAAGVRSTAAQDFQLLFSADQLTARVMYTRIGRVWKVVGKLSKRDWKITSGGKVISTDDRGRFTFQASSLRKTGFELGREERIVVIPPASEVIVE